MGISELIVLLTELREQHGEISIVHADGQTLTPMVSVYMHENKMPWKTNHRIQFIAFGRTEYEENTTDKTAI